MRAGSIVLAIAATLGICPPSGPPPLAIGPTPARDEPAPPDPIWRRLGLPEGPTLESGRGVGVVLIDDGDLHPALRCLGERLKHVTVAEDMSVSLVEPLKDYQGRDDAEYSHGVMALLQMGSAPFRVGDRTYGGPAPGATYFVVPYSYLDEPGGPGGERRYRDDPRLDRALAWVVANRERWNIRVLLLSEWFGNPPAPIQQAALVRNTGDYSLVRSLEVVVKAGILVVNGNGNTSTENGLPPVDYLAVGAYHDSGRADPRFHRENPDEPWGLNNDGHERPDVLAPKYFDPNHRTTDGKLAYFGGTSSASGQVAAVCALLFAQFPRSDARTIKSALIRSGDPLPGSRRPGVRLNAARAIKRLTDGAAGPPWPRISPPVTVADPASSLQSRDMIERALAVSALARQPELFRPEGGEGLRQVFWRMLRDDSPNVRKAAASALDAPESADERRRLWAILHREADMGVRGVLATVLLAGATGDPLDDWIALVTDPNWTARWCAGKVLRDRHPEAPRLDHALLPEEIEEKARPVLDWYRTRKEPR